MIQTKIIRKAVISTKRTVVAHGRISEKVKGFDELKRQAGNL